jgi:endonuclease/exonuclease/phosphatase family metal-dependent hydrolase
MTYNVHRCVGPGGHDSIADITQVCRDAAADIIALQELDAPETDQDGGAHHARDLAAELGMELMFCRTFRRGVGYYGHALLSRHKMELKKVTTFASPHVDAEPRGAIWARATMGTGTLDVISTHLGVHRNERSAQSRELLGDGWLGSPDMRQPTLLCGDMNAVPQASSTYRRFSSRLRDAQRALDGHRPRPTFPSRLPLLRLDHVFVSEDVEVIEVNVPWNGRSRRASDHLPLIVDLELRSLPAAERPNGPQGH